MNAVQVLLFGRVREIVGSHAVEMPPAPGLTAGALLDLLVARYPPLAPWKGSMRVAVNREYAPGTAPVAPGDEVAVIPPVSGG